VVLCLIWLGESGGHETWVFDPGKLEWTKMKPAAEPAHSKSRSRNLVFSPEHNLFILELSSTNNRPELWTYRYRKAEPPLRPASPTNLELLTDIGKVNLTWTVGPSPKAKRYRIYRAEPAEPWLADFKPIGVTARFGFEDKDVTPGKAYFYRVTALADDGTESEPSFRARAQPRVALKPVVSVLKGSRVEIHWNAHPANDIVKKATPPS
jgi:hypothetical protein